VLQIKDILSSNKAMLLLTTSLVVGGCTTTDQQNYGNESSDETPIAESVPATEAGDLSTKRLMRIAKRAWDRGDAPTALRLYSMANQKSPNDPAPLLGAAEVLRKTNRTQAAMDLYRKVTAKQPELVAAHSGIGYTYLSEDKPYLAAKAFEQAVSLDNNNGKSLGGLALSLDTAGEHGKAQDYYRLAIKSDPNNLTYQNNLALSLALIGRTEQAIAMFEIITAHPKATAQHRQNLALVYGMAGKSADAMRYSRMDLNEKDARNNALYFQALNQPVQEQQIAEQAQANAMIAEAHAQKNYRAPNTSRQAYTYIEANNETVALSTNSHSDGHSNVLLAKAEDDPLTSRSVATARKPYTVIEANSETVALNTNTSQEKFSVAQISKKVESNPTYRTTETGRQPHELVKKPVVAVITLEPAQTQVKLSEPTVEPKIAKTHYVEAPLDVEEIIAATSYVIPQGDPIRYNVAAKNTFEATTGAGLYYVQLAAFRSPERAQNAWNMLRKRHGDLLDQFQPVFSVADLGEDKGVFYRVRIGGFSEQAISNEICTLLQQRSEDCYLPRVNAPTVIEDIDNAIAKAKVTSNDGEHTAYIAY